MPRTLRFLALALLLLPVAHAAAQPPGEAKPPAAPQEFFADIVSVNVVNVDVYVTDKKGNPITGLTKDDFQVFEDKRPMAITNFYAVEGRKPAAASDEPPPPAVAAAPGVPAPAAEPIPEDQRLRLIVYIDNFNIHPFNRNRVMRELRTFLNTQVTREDRVMLVTYDRSLKVRRTFTSDPALVSAALSELETVSGHAVHHDSERRDALARIEESESPTQAMGFARTYAESIYNDLQFTIDGMKQIVDVLAGMPGRKAVLYVSDGIPMSAGQELFYAVEQKFGQSASLTESFRFDASRRFRELASQANANRVTFYTIDAAGLRTYSSVSAENAGGAGQSTFIDQIMISNIQSPLFYMAQTTGGVAIVNSNVVGPHLAKIARDFGTYYSLGYQPTHYGDGRYHTIEVKLKRKGLVVRHREGYRDKSAEAQMTDGTLAALNFPYEENPLGIEVAFSRASRQPDGHFLQPIEVKIPLGKLVLVPREQTHEGSVRLYFAVMDSDGGTSEVQQARVPIQVPNGEVDSARGKYFLYTVNLLMRGGEHRVAVGARDDVAAESSFLSRSVRVGAG
jgi:VWFA-related protein